MSVQGNHSLYDIIKSHRVINSPVKSVENGGFSAKEYYNTCPTFCSFLVIKTIIHFDNTVEKSAKISEPNQVSHVCHLATHNLKVFVCFNWTGLE